MVKQLLMDRLTRGEGTMQKSERQPLAQFFLQAKRCGAKARRNKHQPCRQPAMKNGRCRLHGGKSTGPKTEHGKQNSAKANYKHGLYTKSAMIERQNMRMFMQWSDELETF